MRIGLSCTSIESAITQGKIDGIGTYTKNLYEELIQNEQNVVPVSFRNQELPVSEFANSKLLPFSYTISTIASLLNPTPFSIYGGLIKEIDIFHATDHMIPKLKKIPTVSTVHDALMFKYPEWFYNTRFARLKKWTRKKSLQWSNHVITVSHSMVNELEQYCGLDRKKMTVVYNGIAPQWFEPVSLEEKTRVSIKYQLPKKYLLFAATLHPKKNLPNLIRAYLQLPIDMQKEYPLIIVGRSGWDTEESIAAIKVLENKKLGRWLNYLALDELRVIFQNATLYLHPSLHEGFGLTLLQAFASRTPVLTSNITAMPEIAADAAYLVDPKSVEEIREGIKKLLTNRSLCEDLITKGTKRAKQFSWEKCAKETLAVYQRCLSSIKF